MCAPSVAAAGASPSFESPRQYQPVRQLIEAPQVPHAIAREEEVRARPPATRDRPQIDLADLRRATHPVAVRVEVSNGPRHRNILGSSRGRAEVRAGGGGRAGGGTAGRRAVGRYPTCSSSEHTAASVCSCVVPRRTARGGGGSATERSGTTTTENRSPRAFLTAHSRVSARRTASGSSSGSPLPSAPSRKIGTWRWWRRRWWWWWCGGGDGGGGGAAHLLAARAVVDPLHILRRRHLAQPSILRQVRRAVLFH